MKLFNHREFNPVRIVLLLLLASFATIPAFAQKLKESELTDYEWICLNSNLWESDLYLKDTLILLREREMDDEEGSEIINTNDCFRFSFTDSTHLLSVSAIDYRNASMKRVVTVDSLLYEQLKRDVLLTSEAFESTYKQLGDVRLGDHIIFENASDPKAQFHVQLRKNGFLRLSSKPVYVVSAEQLDGATWSFDSKQQEIIITDLKNNIVMPQHYTVQRISSGQLRLIRTTIVLR